MKNDKFAKLSTPPTQWKRDEKIGFYIPNYINVVYRKPAMDNIIAYATYTELTGRKTNSVKIIEKKFSKFFLRDIIQWLSKINFILARNYTGINVDDYNLAKVFTTNWGIKNLEFWRGKRKFLSRQQMLANIKLALLNSKDSRRKSLVSKNIREASELLFRVTDFLESGREKTKVSQDKPQVLALLARNIVLNEGYDYAAGLGRYYYIFNKIGERFLYRNKLTMLQLFKKSSGADFNFYSAVGFAIWGFYRAEVLSERLKKPEEYIFSSRYFKKTNEFTQKNHKKSLALISNSFRGFKKELLKDNQTGGELYSFQAFFRSPLIRDGENFYLIDASYFERRLTEGAFWQIFDRAKTDVERNTLKGYWGVLFQNYVYDLTDSIYQKTGRFFSEIKGDDTGGVDVIIEYPSCVVLAEITTQSIPHNVWLRANVKEIKTQLQKLLIRGERRGKAKQLYDLWIQSKTNGIKVNGRNLAAGKRVIPIIIFEQSMPSHDAIWDLFKEVLSEAGFNEEFSDNLLCWNIQDYETALGAVEGGLTITELVDSMAQEGYLHNSVKNFFYLKQRRVSKPKFCKKNFDEFTKLATQLLFR